jgi:DNA-binding NarL/FixJ family response regulator
VAAVLIADDDALVRMTLRIALQRRGHQVTEASDGDEVVALVGESIFDLCIMDLDMPGGRIEKRLAAIAESDPAPAVLILSGFDVAGDASPVPGGGPRVLRRRKPIDLAGLDEALAQLDIPVAAADAR